MAPPASTHQVLPRAPSLPCERPDRRLASCGAQGTGQRGGWVASARPRRRRCCHWPRPTRASAPCCRRAPGPQAAPEDGPKPGPPQPCPHGSGTTSEAAATQLAGPWPHRSARQRRRPMCWGAPLLPLLLRGRRRGGGGHPGAGRCWPLGAGAGRRSTPAEDVRPRNHGRNHPQRLRRPTRNLPCCSASPRLDHRQRCAAAAAPFLAWHRSQPGGGGALWPRRRIPPAGCEPVPWPLRPRGRGWGWR